MPQSGAFAPLAIEARHLACSRNGRLVFSNLSFRVASGTLLAVVGPNGSGKSSLLRLLAGLLRPHGGSLVLEGRAEDDAVAHYLGHADALKSALTLRETLRFWSALFGGDRKYSRRIDAAAETVGLGHALDLPGRVLSAGQRRRAGLGRLLLAERPLWLLDEPDAALDQAGRELLENLMRRHLAARGLIVMATHQTTPVTPDVVLDLSEPT
jgi:heme exporter protein A